MNMFAIGFCTFGLLTCITEGNLSMAIVNAGLIFINGTYVFANSWKKKEGTR